MDNTGRLRMPRDVRQQYVRVILASLHRHLDTPPTSRVVRGDLRNLALHIEEEIFQAAADYSDYATTFSARMFAISQVRARARVTDNGIAEAPDIEESPGAVPIQNGVPLQRAVPREEELSAHFPNAVITNVSSGGEEHFAKLLQDFPNAVVTESDGMVSLQVYLDAQPTLRVVRGDLRTLALRIEDKNFLAATSESDYYWKIARRILAITRARATGTPMALAAEIDMAQYTDLQHTGTTRIQLFRNGFQVNAWSFLAEAQQRRRNLAQTLQDCPNAIAMESSAGDKVLFLLP